MRKIETKNKFDRDKFRKGLSYMVTVYAIIAIFFRFNLFWAITGINVFSFGNSLIGIVDYYKRRVTKLPKDDVLTIVFTIICEIGLLIYLMIQ